MPSPTNLLPGPASTELAIYCAWRLRGPLGAVVGGLCFILPGLAIILALSAVFLAAHPPRWVQGAAAGAGAAVPAVAVKAAIGLLPGSWRRAGTAISARARWILYLVAGGVAEATIGPWIVLALAACGLIETAVRAKPWPPSTRTAHLFLSGAIAPTVAFGGLAALAWVAFKVGALSYGGGFVIIPLMQHDAVHTYHWMTSSQFLSAVALGQVTPGPVVLTVSVVGYAATGIGGGLLAALIAFTPSFAFIIFGAPHFERLRASTRIQAFFTGAGAAAIGAIAGSAIPLGLALSHVWQLGIVGLTAIWLHALRRSVVAALVTAGILGVIAALAGLPTGP